MDEQTTHPDTKALNEAIKKLIDASRMTERARGKDEHRAATRKLYIAVRNLKEVVRA